ncbi:MAG: hypothetical protein ISS35_04965 [Kiritimatiellae bacterium]|nr:hypothetical protein [Kiritimatiellia bacterium]
MTKKTMTSRERVLAAVNHEEPDRVPIDLGGNQTYNKKAPAKPVMAVLDTAGGAE